MKHNTSLEEGVFVSGELCCLEPYMDHAVKLVLHLGVTALKKKKKKKIDFTGTATDAYSVDANSVGANSAQPHGLITVHRGYPSP